LHLIGFIRRAIRQRSGGGKRKLPQKLAELQARPWRDASTRAPLRVMFQDEARFGRIVDMRRCWCPKPWRPVCRAIVSRQYTYAYAAVSVNDGRLDTLVLPHVNAECMQLFVDEVAQRHPKERIVLVLDGAGWHHELVLQWPPNVRPLLLPPYSPELNPVEHLWDELREKYFHNRFFDSLEAVEEQLEHALRSLEHDAQRARSITAWSWIITSLPT
jgi:transposase